jgi:hypothetical protein
LMPGRWAGKRMAQWLYGHRQEGAAVEQEGPCVTVTQDSLPANCFHGKQSRGCCTTSTASLDTLATGSRRRPIGSEAVPSRRVLPGRGEAVCSMHFSDFQQAWWSASGAHFSSAECPICEHSSATVSSLRAPRRTLRRLMHGEGCRGMYRRRQGRLKAGSLNVLHACLCTTALGLLNTPFVTTLCGSFRTRRCLQLGPCRLAPQTHRHVLRRMLPHSCQRPFRRHCRAVCRGMRLRLCRGKHAGRQTGFLNVLDACSCTSLPSISVS